jgi:hypothetical protein
VTTWRDARAFLATAAAVDALALALIYLFHLLSRIQP